MLSTVQLATRELCTCRQATASSRIACEGPTTDRKVVTDFSQVGTLGRGGQGAWEAFLWHIDSAAREPGTAFLAQTPRRLAAGMHEQACSDRDVRASGGLWGEGVDEEEGR